MHYFLIVIFITKEMNLMTSGYISTFYSSVASTFDFQQL